VITAVAVVEFDAACCVTCWTNGIMTLAEVKSPLFALRKGACA